VVDVDEDLGTTVDDVLIIENNWYQQKTDQNKLL
jgi:hypothetical protein